MAFRGLKLFKLVRSANVIRNNAMLMSSSMPFERKLSIPKGELVKPKQYKTEDNYVYLEDPDTFGTLTRDTKSQDEVLEDEGDIQEQELIENSPLPSQKLTMKQYSDLIKQYLKQKRLKEALDVLEVRMIKQDRVKPNNYIYNILIGACAEVGYTKKAFRLYNDMKRRGLKVTGDTYTCLFEACANSPWALDGLKNAKHLRNLMIDKGIEPNLTNYNAMIKAFGRCGDLTTAFKIIDEMIAKKIKIRVHTLNNLLHACISDKNSGLRHGLIVWRKMLKLKEKPNIYSFNLMLKCVKECNLGSKEDIEELIRIIQEETPLAIEISNQVEILQISSSEKLLNPPDTPEERLSSKQAGIGDAELKSCDSKNKKADDNIEDVTSKDSLVPKKDEFEVSIDDSKQNCNKLTPVVNTKTVTLQFVDKLPAIKKEERTVPNLLSKKIKMQQVLALQEVQTLQDKFAIIGGQEDFIKEMEAYSVKPDLKTITQMLAVLDDSIEAENKLIETMKSLEIKADIDFYNMLIKKRCLRSDYEGAMAVKQLIEEDNKLRKKTMHPLNKKIRLKPDIMSYGVLAMACKTKESAEQLLNEMKEKKLKINIQILGTLLRQGTAHNDFGYVLYIMNVSKEENVPVNNIFLKHLENFNNKCCYFIKNFVENSEPISKGDFKCHYKKFSSFYNNWLKDINLKEVLEPEHPWQQFRENYPEPLQQTKFKIEEPKKFYKRSRKFVKYVG
ncbi:pentatricopeptide repeat-containing protein 1, mitochondrial [Pectinophora gossypiella]|uniref:pentatricopeptide repeat-containing protein 1, mitochondrial n=1 Tax=Pectinophora gossypiella TaxID=13191 RepID=UPI00214E98B9|nr:pentatricopeptide repeat-containing protein 1, mitochondrial [Pectinophora gossypiella]